MKTQYKNKAELPASAIRFNQFTVLMQGVIAKEYEEYRKDAGKDAVDFKRWLELRGY